MSEIIRGGTEKNDLAKLRVRNLLSNPKNQEHHDHVIFVFIKDFFPFFTSFKQLLNLSKILKILRVVDEIVDNKSFEAEVFSTVYEMYF